MAAAYSHIVQTTSLCRRFGGVLALSNIDFRLEPGALHCLIGPNGAGKSTFFKLLTGQIAPSSGQVLFAGNDITGLRRHEIARLGIGIKNQTPDVFDGITARQNIYLAARFAQNGVDAERVVEQTIDDLSLNAIAHRQVGQLAHGQRQWVEIAMVLARSPDLILLDEPSAGMSAEERIQMAEMLNRLRGRAAIIVVEHDMKFIKRIASVVTVFHQGRILRQNHIDEVLADPVVRDIYLGRQEPA